MSLVWDEIKGWHVVDDELKIELDEQCDTSKCGTDCECSERKPRLANQPSKPRYAVDGD